MMAVHAPPPPATVRRRPRPARAAAIVERNLLIYRHTPAVLVGEVFEPVLYLLSIGVGIGYLIDGARGSGGGALGYTGYVATGLLATAAMNGAVNEATFTMFRKLRIDRVYDSILATPVGVRGVVLGELAWATIRSVLAAAGFLAVIAAFGLVSTPRLLFALPAAALIGFAFAGAGMAAATWVRGWQDFQFVQLFMLPMFLFSTTFYPVDVYPRPVQVLVEALPLYQSIQLVREPVLGHFDPGLLVAVVYLLTMGAVLGVLAERRLTKTLLH